MCAVQHASAALMLCSEALRENQVDEGSLALCSIRSTLAVG
jgi:hypothetical protein